MKKSLDNRLARIQADSNCREFILADAKDADMALGISAPGRNNNFPDKGRPFRTLAEYRESMRQIVRQGLVDIMLMSASSNEQLSIQERLFDNSPVTPAVRMNDTTDIWCGNSGSYASQPSLPFQSTTIDHALYGRLESSPEQPPHGAKLGLYSITFNDDAILDRQSLQAYKEFRLEAESKRFRHFLEIFAPNHKKPNQFKNVGAFMNDCIVRTLAGITRSAAPRFLKIPYLGPAAMEDLANYDPSLVIGILGGSAGTTMDAFQLLFDAKKHGARAALFGRKINQAEDPLSFVRHLRLLADGEIEPSEAVRSYHSDLQKSETRSHRSLAEDLLTTG